MNTFRKFIKVKNWDDTYSTQRMVNQPEIVNYIKKNPGKTENQIMYSIYGYDRNNTHESNKKYAECLRRALRKGSINRQEVEIDGKKTYTYYCESDSYGVIGKWEEDGREEWDVLHHGPITYEEALEVAKRAGHTWDNDSNQKFKHIPHQEIVISFPALQEKINNEMNY